MATEIKSAAPKAAPAPARASAPTPKAAPSKAAAPVKSEGAQPKDKVSLGQEAQAAKGGHSSVQGLLGGLLGSFGSKACRAGEKCKMGESEGAKKPEEAGKAEQPKKPEESKQSREAKKPEESKLAEPTKKPEETHKAEEAKKPKEAKGGDEGPAAGGEGSGAGGAEGAAPAGGAEGAAPAGEAPNPDQEVRELAMAVLMRGAGGGGFQAQSFPGGAGLDGPGVGGFGKIGGQPGELKGLLRQKYQQQGGDESTSLSDTTKALSKAALGGGQPQSPAGGPGFF